MIEDVTICDQIYGPNILCLKGKTVQKKAESIVKDLIGISQEAYHFYICFKSILAIKECHFKLAFYITLLKCIF